MVSYSGQYWLKHKDAPFVTFLAVVETHVHSEAGSDDLNALKRRVRRDRDDDDELRTFKQEFQRLLEGDRAGLPKDAITLAADGPQWRSDEQFLAWLWNELYPDEPPPRRASGGGLRGHGA